MAKIIEEVAVRISADTRKLEKGMKRSKKQVGALTSQFKKLGGIMVATFSARALFQGFKRTLDMGDALIKTAKGVGFTVNEYQRLIFALAQVGVSAGSAKIAIGDFQKRLSKAVAGVSPQFQKAFEQAGLDTAALSKMSPAEAFNTAMTHLATLRDSPAIAGLTGNVFEEQSGKDVLQVLRQFEKYTVAREKFGRRVGQISKRQVDDIQRLREETKLYGQQWDILKLQIVADAAPEINAALKSIVDSGGLEALAKMFAGIADKVLMIVSGLESIGAMLDNLPIPDWLFKDGGPITAIRNKAARTIGLDHAPTSIFDAANMLTSGPPSFEGTPWGRRDFAGGGTTNVNIRVTRGSNEITDREAKRIRKQFEQLQGAR